METRGRGRTEGGFLEEGVRAGVGGGGGDAHCLVRGVLGCGLGEGGGKRRCWGCRCR